VLSSKATYNGIHYREAREVSIFFHERISDIVLVVSKASEGSLKSVLDHLIDYSSI